MVNSRSLMVHYIKGNFLRGGRVWKPWSANDALWLGLKIQTCFLMIFMKESFWIFFVGQGISHRTRRTMWPRSIVRAMPRYYALTFTTAVRGSARCHRVAQTDLKLGSKIVSIVQCARVHILFAADNYVKCQDGTRVVVTWELSNASPVGWKIPVCPSADCSRVLRQKT